MRSSKLMLAVPVLLSLVLGACSKDSKHSIKAKAATAVTKEQQISVYEEAEASIEKDIAVLNENGVNTMNKGVSFKRFFNDNVYMSVKDAEVVQKKLKSIISKSESQISLAKKLGDDEKLAHAEKTKAAAERTLGYL